MLSLWSWFHETQQAIAWGAWEGGQLVAHYSCLMRSLHLPNHDDPVLVGLSTNMAVHPGFRGRGLVKQVAAPVYAELERLGAVAGVGFSDAEGVTVDRRSRSYGYHVVGKMQPVLVWPSRRLAEEAIDLAEAWPDLPWGCAQPRGKMIHFGEPPDVIRQRCMTHPFRRYRFGTWVDDGVVRGMVIDQPLRAGGVSGSVLCAIYTDDIDELLRRWICSARLAGTRFIYMLSTPASPVLLALRRLGVCWPLPFARSPYYLTVKPLKAQLASLLLDFGCWDCIGGDIL
jgi:hypothetical protein